MPKCSICSSDQRIAIDKALVAGEAHRAIASRFGVGRASVQRHAKSCIAVKLRRAAKRRELDSDSLLEDLLILRASATRLFQKAEAAESWAGAASALREARATTEMLGRMIGALQPEAAPNVNVAVFQGGDWPALRDRILTALERHPEARADVIAALSGEAPALPSNVIDAEFSDA